jgi:hypothetical protein
MTQQPQRPTEVLGALPHRRPSRRSEKRDASAPPRGERASGRPAAAPLTNASPPRDARSPNDARSPDSPSDANLASGREIAGTVVQAAAELAEIGLSMSARALREAVARLPRP